MNRRANSTARSPALARNRSPVNAAASAYLRAATQQGSSLLELIVALIIVGLLATLALPSYQRHVMRMRRSEAHGVLLELATAQELHYLQQGRYAQDDLLAVARPAGLGLARRSQHGWYQLAITGADAIGFVATATASDTQAADFECTILGIDALGQRFALRAGGGSSAVCWRQ